MPMKPASDISDAPIAKVVEGMARIPQAAWDALLDPQATPFMSWSFLEALEQSGSVSPEEGWLPIHLTLWRGERLIAAAPAYVKGDSMGDFSRDWGWVGAYQRSGLSYYPKMVIGVPFSPVVGRRFLVHPDEDHASCLRVLARLALAMAEENELSSVQVLYCLEDEARLLEGERFAPRVAFQFHWFNKGYECRDSFLATFRSKRRNQLKREWRAPNKYGIDIQTLRHDTFTADPELWAQRTHGFYAQTVERYMWRDPYLKPSFYQRIFEAMPEHLEVVAAHDDSGRFLAGAFNVIAPGRVWGRYWGSVADVPPFLHFNVCLYHSIDRAIAEGVEVFEGGEGGQHKLRRGFEPAFTHHAFHFVHPAMHRGLSRYLAEEGAARRQELIRFQEECRR